MVLRGHTSLVPVVGAACNQKKNEKNDDSSSPVSPSPFQ
uniref:Uncharacterized protein n=1 Tax=Anguilla anguilla TaxID=7936 RepID=A0A0E9VN45_ANGAN